MRRKIHYDTVSRSVPDIPRAVSGHCQHPFVRELFKPAHDDVVRLAREGLIGVARLKPLTLAHCGQAVSLGRVKRIRAKGAEPGRHSLPAL